jgi:hypothetical protein
MERVHSFAVELTAAVGKGGGILALDLIVFQNVIRIG